MRRAIRLPNDLQKPGRCLGWLRTISTFICTNLIAVTVPAYIATLFATPAGAQTSSASAQPAPAPFTSKQLHNLVAPIALYPDALVAQVLAAAMHPDEIAFADDWLSQNKNLTGTSLVQAVDQQSWDPSVKALTQFPRFFMIWQRIFPGRQVWARHSTLNSLT
jgi:hypothetical protein